MDKFCIIFFTDPDFTFRSCFLDYTSPHFRIQITWGKERKRMTQAEKLVPSGRKRQILTRKCPERIQQLMARGSGMTGLS